MQESKKTSIRIHQFFNIQSRFSLM